MKIFFSVILLLLSLPLLSQDHGGRPDKPDKDEEKKKTTIYSDVRTWRMLDDYTIADTTVVDTILTTHQIINPIWRHNLANVTLGNAGSPTLSLYFPSIRRIPGFVFHNAIADFLEEPDDWIYYNTKTPYSNFTYQMGYPGRRSDEYVHILFTQNINRRANLGAKFSLSSSIGRYEASRTDHVNFRVFGSFDGENYHNYYNYVYHKASIYENGGMANDDDIIHPSEDRSDKPEDIQINLMNANNYIGRYQFFYGHYLNIAHVERMDTDSVVVQVPIASVHHTMLLERSHHEFVAEDLETYAEESLDNVFLRHKTILNPARTSDKSKYQSFRNVFQIKMSEEFNKILQFGLRAYLINDVRVYRWEDHSEVVFDTATWDDSYVLHRQKEFRTSTYVGGQIFKNLGDNFRWNAGVKLCLQGYDVGDFTVDGNLTTMFDVWKRKATIYANANFSLRTPEIFEEKYISNHFEWNKNFSAEKTFYAEAGVKLDDKKGKNMTDLKAFVATLNKRIYYGLDCLPSQKDGVTQIVGVYWYQHFEVIGFNSIDRMALQFTSDNDVVALPLYGVYSSDFYEHSFFKDIFGRKVLTLQIGFDFHYNTKFYAPAYQPALMAFYVQHEREVGNYFYWDPFVNIHIKRVRFYFKYDHVNCKWGSRDYFSTIHYPSNPGMIRWGFSWNFYD